MQSQYDDIKEEIKQLQVCLVNKLLSEPIPAKATASSMVNDESLNADATTKLSEIVTVLNSFKQVRDNDAHLITEDETYLYCM